MRTTYTGAVDSTFTSLPYGDSLAGSPDDDPYHFAGNDHDSTGLEHAFYRDYSSLQARWIRPDPSDNSYNYGNPQSLNRYAYAGNSPFTYADPLGLQQCSVGCGVDEGMPMMRMGNPSLGFMGTWNMMDVLTFLGYITSTSYSGTTTSSGVIDNGDGTYTINVNHSEQERVAVDLDSPAFLMAYTARDLGFEPGTMGVVFFQNVPQLPRPNAPPASCSYYDARCKTGDRYSCKAGQCCRDFGDTPANNELRACLLFYDQLCANNDQACRINSHLACYTGNGRVPYVNIWIPASCRKTALGF